MALYNPYRSDMVATLGETTGFVARQLMLYRMKQDPVGREILRLQPRVKSWTVDLNEMRSLQEGTFGREYARFMDDNGLDQDSRDDVKFVDDIELAYVMQRYRDIHDFTHTLTGLPTVSVAGEIAVKWFEMVQTGLPMCTLGSIFGPLNPEVTPKHREQLRSYYIPWALSNGMKAKFIMNVFYERHFEEPIDSLRKKMNLTPARRLDGW
ncbi:predicted protein [Nematostella vectensis]|uniref:Ubiquinone biosynthesis protein COQ4 homolog, mitochondrial n=2 Tax=Nematostella vectensis TaxID=45351 RepID=COQ4_NEMVE|nr:RecName: Full=Ubiquinone biosynthesis protein COQ4 homolog, mitochondrial; AltName: Full=Coenzyme Q biosynthesis protein 4 homolog [Nematostella vectensis]EDO34664.1 predicted protein [Nematostella vectensis]|eukprot:XP_001626764.1 predicted protein [Nematostella vectensis]